MLSHKTHKLCELNDIHGYLRSIYPPKPKYSARLTETSRGLHSPPLPRIDYQLIAMLQHPFVMTRQQQREQRTS
jgi:hypothetical protein